MPIVCWTIAVALLAMLGGCTSLRPIPPSEPSTRMYDYVYVVDVPRGFAAMAATAFTKCGLIVLSRQDATQLSARDRNRLLTCSMTASRALDDLVEDTSVTITQLGDGNTQKTPSTTPAMAKITVNITMQNAAGEAIYGSRGEHVGEKGQELSTQRAAIDLALGRITGECVERPNR